MRLPFTPILVLSVVAAPVLVQIGCTTPLGENAETSEQATTAEDLAVAKQILTLLGGPSGKCKSCHTATPENVRTWGTAMEALDAACFAPPALTSMQRVDCMRTTPSDPSSAFTAHKLGLYAAGGPLADMQALFDDAFPAATAATAFATFRQQAAMPRG